MNKFLDEFEETWIDDCNDSNFNIGDKIICISKSEDFYKITIGKEYEIIGFRKYHFLVINDAGFHTWYDSSRFKLITSQYTM